MNKKEQVGVAIGMITALLFGVAVGKWGLGPVLQTSLVIFIGLIKEYEAQQL
jgi:hypothetical protein